MTIKITHSEHTDRMYTRIYEIFREFTLHDRVLFIPNGCEFTVDNEKMLRWMRMSGNYVKIIEK